MSDELTADDEATEGPVLDETFVEFNFEYENAESRFDAREWALMEAQERIYPEPEEEVTEQSVTALYQDYADDEIPVLDQDRQYDGPGHYTVRVSFRVE